ncbi:MAG: NADH-quinone oxidoreductase subunit L [Acidobacteriales bacterium]|nr:NADH-quinone oxidoreductase subunit L [Terriglobales bacterium]
MNSAPALNLWIIPLLPLVGAAINGFVGARFSKKLVAAIALLFPALSFLWAIYAIARVQYPYQEIHAPWIAISGFQVNFGFALDQLSTVMLLVVTGVGFLIHIYATGYMAEEGGYYRFFSYLNLFMFFMLMLILANSYLLMFVGWEGVGLASYLLIGFYFRKQSAANAGKKAFITNRIGDFAFLLGMFLVIQHFGSLDFAQVFPQVSKLATENHAGLLTAIGILFTIGATGKSAQIPLYVWLPDAMEGPTPVSALIHAATMVTAGVYMTARSSAIFDRAPIALTFVAVIGAVTAIFAASIGIVQTDIKRVLAYSTISQLGYMFLACGVAAYSAGIFHLMTHAFFKALLFLSAGSVIHGIAGEQDMRRMGGLRKYMPYTFAVMGIATLAISGIPPFAGFFSKDEILWRAWQHSKVLWAIGAITAFMTSFYMFRLLYLTFMGERRADAVIDANEEPTAGTHAPTDAHSAHGQQHLPAHDDHANHAHHDPHESPWIMLGPLVILAILSVIGGWIGIPHALGGANRFEAFLAPVFEQYAPEHAAAERGQEIPAQTSSSSSTAPSAAETQPGLKQNAAAEREGAGPDTSDKGMELTLTGVSVALALAGWLLAYYFYGSDLQRPERVARRLHGIYRTLWNKYWIDELYSAVFVQPVVRGSTNLLWRGLDVDVIDGTVNGAGATASGFSAITRRMQSGYIRSYAAWVAAGAAAVIAYMIYTGVAH